MTNGFRWDVNVKINLKNQNYLQKITIDRQLLFDRGRLLLSILFSYDIAWIDTK